MKELTKRFIFWFALAACITGVYLRFSSYFWNDALMGDVNLFALTARQYALDGRLEYPMKYEFSKQVAYRTLTTPASQHPPLWPVLASQIAKRINSQDTFSILKLLSELTGIILIAITAIVAREAVGINELNIPNRAGLTTVLLSCSLVSLSAVLVDFSANGSPYILMALWLMCDTGLLLHFEPRSIYHLLLAGIFCALGILTHSSLIFMPLCFIVVIFASKPQDNSKTSLFKSRIFQLAFFLLILFIGLLPWLIWNMRHFGQAIYSYSSYYIFERMGLVSTEISNGVITSQLISSLSASQIFQRYCLLASKSFYAICREFILITGPFALVLFILGVHQGMKVEKRKIWLWFLPCVGYILAILIWATYKFRFLIPILPMFYLISAVGFIAASHWGKIWRWIAGICLAGTFIWMILPFFREVKSLYYGEESPAHAELYMEMKPLAQSLAALPQGVVLGYSELLDGGIETIYWHRFPFVAGRGMDEAEIKKLVSDFNVRYIWVDTTTGSSTEKWFPSARRIGQSGDFMVLELPIP